MPVGDLPPVHNLEPDSAWVESRTVPGNKRDEAEKLLRRLQGRLPNTPMTDIEVTPMDGLYAIHTKNGPTIYTDGSGTYLMIGVVFDLNTGKALHGDAGTSVREIK